MRPKHRPRRTREKADGRAGPASTIYITCVVGACAVLAVLALPMIVPPAKPSAPANNAKDAPKPWDAPSGGAQAGLENISRGTHAAGAARLTPDPVAAVRDGSMRYSAERLAEIRDEIAAIDANPSSTAADAERRRLLVEEQRRLLRY